MRNMDGLSVLLVGGEQRSEPGAHCMDWLSQAAPWVACQQVADATAAVARLRERDGACELVVEREMP